MKHEDEFTEEITEVFKKLQESANHIINKHDDIKRERDDLVAFLRRCEKTNESEVIGIISDFLINYDIPF